MQVKQGNFELYLFSQEEELIKSALADLKANGEVFNITVDDRKDPSVEDGTIWCQMVTFTNRIAVDLMLHKLGRHNLATTPFKYVYKTECTEANLAAYKERIYPIKRIQAVFFRGNTDEYDMFGKNFSHRVYNNIVWQISAGDYKCSTPDKVINVKYDVEVTEAADEMKFRMDRGEIRYPHYSGGTMKRIYKTRADVNGKFLGYSLEYHRESLYGSYWSPDLICLLEANVHPKKRVIQWRNGLEDPEYASPSAVAVFEDAPTLDQVRADIDSADEEARAAFAKYIHDVPTKDFVKQLIKGAAPKRAAPL